MSVQIAEKVITEVKSSLDKIVPMMQELEKQANLTTGKIMEVKHANKMGDLKCSLEYYGSQNFYYKSTCEDIVNAALAHGKMLFNESTAIHEANKDAIANNIEVRNKISMFMKATGISETYSTYEYPSSRSRQKKRVSHSSGWMGDLQRCVTIDDGYSVAISSHEDFKRRVEEYRKRHEKEENDRKMAEEKATKEKENNNRRIMFCVKYELDPDSSWSDILETILGKNKYLKLAYWLMRNRGDWGEGYHYAKIGIESFTVEYDIDREIAKDINDCIAMEENGDVDDRIFRDCTWNYNRILELVTDEKLLIDFNEINGNVEAY